MKANMSRSMDLTMSIRGSICDLEELFSRREEASALGYEHQQDFVIRSVYGNGSRVIAEDYCIVKCITLFGLCTVMGVVL